MHPSRLAPYAPFFRQMPGRRLGPRRFFLQDRCAPGELSTRRSFASLLVDLGYPRLLWPFAGGALPQKPNSDLCCCFSCFDAGPERAVHPTRDGPPGPRQPDPSHREKRCVFVTGQCFSPPGCLPSPSHHRPVALTPAFESVVQAHGLLLTRPQWNSFHSPSSSFWISDIVGSMWDNVKLTLRSM